jgi:hypothetical protein
MGLPAHRGRSNVDVDSMPSHVDWFRYKDVVSDANRGRNHVAWLETVHLANVHSVHVASICIHTLDAGTCMYQSLADRCAKSVLPTCT